MNERLTRAMPPLGPAGVLVRLVLPWAVSLGATVGAAALALSGGRPTAGAIALLVVLASLQIILQLGLFLHVATGPQHRLNAVLLAAMLVIVAILVAGSLWILHSLDVRMTTQQEMQYMNSQNSI